MRTRTDYEQAFSLVRAAIARWDPYRLLGNGAPEDEFDPEVTLLLPRLQHLRSGSEIAAAVAAIFGERFEKESFDSNACEEVGNDIYTSLSAAGLLQMTGISKDVV